MAGTLTRYPVDDSPDPAAWRAGVERDYGAPVAPLAAHSPAPGLPAAAWLMLRATMVSPGRVDRTTKEAVAAAVAHANSCWYCEELHVTVLESLNDRRSADNDVTSLADRRTGQLTAWARRPARPLPFPDWHVPELVGTVVVSHYLNRIAMVLSSSDTDGFAAVAERAHAVPGTGAGPLPDAPVPTGFAWAGGQQEIASAFARAAVVFDAAGARAVPERVRTLVLDRLAVWHGEQARLDHRVLAGWLRGLPGDDRLAGRLALLTALSPGQAEPLLVSTYREQHGERGLVELACWASFEAARRVGELVAPGRPMAEPAADEVHRVLPFHSTRRHANPRFPRRAGV
ncbi:MAG TPA: carboxymuconolactone decarboxylase family protein [Pseudonocardiaceae bacterium]|jgi:AhpD family alkylhydroperoxidase|nr:carboxymuconolactone decarboxylase family protein [Pseudonocardiaceae bacterium]